MRLAVVRLLTVTILCIVVNMPALSGPKETAGFGSFSWFGVQQKWTYRAIGAAEGPVLSGKYSERFEIRTGDCGATRGFDYDDCAHHRERAQWNENGSTPLDKLEYYSFSVLIPQGSP